MNTAANGRATSAKKALHERRRRTICPLVAAQSRGAARRCLAGRAESKRLSRFLAAVNEPPAARERQDAAPALSDIENEPEAAPAEDEVVSDLPPVEGLNFQSDFTAFMRKNVPEALRRAALRKLWGSDPVLANLDGLNDYCEDFNVTDTPITLAQTSYRVGKGYFDEAEEKLSKLGDARTAQSDKSSNARRGESSKRSAESPVVADSGDAPDQAPRENVAAVEEEPCRNAAGGRRQSREWDGKVGRRQARLSFLPNLLQRNNRYTAWAR